MKTLNILVVEDNAQNIEAAKRQLHGHNLTIFTGYDQAHEALMEKKIDWVAVKAEMMVKLPEGWRMNEPGRYGADISNPDGDVCPAPYYMGLPVEIELDLLAAKERASSGPFDVILTDVMIPKGGNKCMSREGMALAERQGAVPYGPIIALRALQVGVKLVGVLTAGNHHADPFVFAFDHLDGFVAGDIKVICSNNMNLYVDCEFTPCEFNSGRCDRGEIFPVKNWGKLLNELVN